MDIKLIAKVSITINAPKATVWDALVNPQAIRQYMFGTQAISDWQKGSPIVWKGEWQGKAYEDKGIILKLEPEKILQYSHFSPLSGLADNPDNYHIVTIELLDKGDQTQITLSQDNNATDEERQHSEKNWEMMLSSLERYLKS
jgi:uncharacterized protein YndB with AHSA1/START domain